MIKYINKMLHERLARKKQEVRRMQYEKEVLQGTLERLKIQHEQSGRV